MSDKIAREQDYGREIMHLIGQLERRRRRFINDALRDTGLCGTMFMYLLMLERDPGSSQDFLCERLWMDKSIVARTVRKLEDFGYIRRELDASNRRQYKIELSESGQALMPRIKGLMRDWQKLVTRGMDETQRSQTAQLLRHMISNAEE